jgi:8-oxo-dGTP diphosphatase
MAKLVFVVAAALIDTENRVLLAQRPSGKTLAGLWEFPGGKIDAGERPEAALVRELHEELAIDVDTQDLRPITFASYAYPDFHLMMPIWAVRKWQGDPSPQEGQDIVWVPPKDLANFPMPPADVPLIGQLQTFLAKGSPQ